MNAIRVVGIDIAVGKETLGLPDGAFIVDSLCQHCVGFRFADLIID